MRSGLALVVVLAAAGALAVATAGAPFSDQLGETEITLEQSAGPNGVYAVEDDGELAIRITEARQELAADGVNPEGVTTIEDIFRIVNAENQTAEVWIETDVEDVEFRTGTDSIEGPNNSMTLEAGEDVAVGLRIDTTGEDDVEQIEAFTVRADPVSEASQSEDDGETSASVGGGGGAGDATASGGSEEESGGTTGDDGSPEDSEETTTEGESEEGSEEPATEDEPADDGGDRDDQSDTAEDPTTGDEDGQSDETGADGPGDATDDETAGEEETTNEDGTTGDGTDDGPTDLGQTGQTAPFEPAQTLGGFLPQLLGLVVAIGAGAGLVAAARAIVGAGGN